MVVKSLIAWQRAVVTISIISKVMSVCRHNLAYVCQVASRKMSSLMLLSSSSGNSLSNVGIAHCY
jgi:hypothetical protein